MEKSCLTGAISKSNYCFYNQFFILFKALKYKVQKRRKIQKQNTTKQDYRNKYLK